MNRLKQMLRAVLILLTASFPSHAWRLPIYPPQRPLVQMAILLDTSNSMDGLIEQAKSQLWRIANDLAYSTRRGERPVLQVALYEYGNNTLARGENFVRQVLPFTSDLDRVSQHLFALRTNGGEEFCGAVVRDAVDALVWDSRSDVYKVIFIAGNEPFTQGPVFFRDAMARAIQKGITVNPIFCGRHEEGVQTAWLDGAVAGHGTYLTIDANQRIVVDPTPFDEEISRLGTQLNDTYVAYGSEGRSAYEMRKEADQSAEVHISGGAPVERSLFKASPAYQPAAMDVVSEVATNKVGAASLNRADLPVALKEKSADELTAYFKAQQKARESLQARIGELKKSREKFLSQRQVEKGAGLSLDQAILKAVREQAGRLQFHFAQ